MLCMSAMSRLHSDQSQQFLLGGGGGVSILKSGVMEKEDFYELE